MKKDNDSGYRHELKYYIHDMDRLLITSEIMHFLSIDSNTKNNQYMIRSLYFDDLNNSAYEEKIMGIAHRKKYRIRVYNCNDKTIRLERKTKQNEYIHKEAVVLTHEEAEKLISGEYSFLEYRKEDLCREFYIECITKGMRPKVIVDYDRIPFIYAPGDVRITFDRNVRTGLLGFDLFDKELPTIEVLKKDELIMEVKYTEFLPQFIRNLLSSIDCEQTAISKYVLCFDKKQQILG